jgi:hypothetical protein
MLGAAGLTIAYAVMRELSLVPPEGINPVRQFDLNRYLGSGMRSVGWKTGLSAAL